MSDKTSLISCGIDFGTSNSSIALNSEAAIKLIDVESNKPTIPSAMFFSHEKEPTTFGRNAIDQFLNGKKGRLMRSLKRVLGTSLMKQGTMMNGKIKKFDDIIGEFLLNIKQKAEMSNSQTIDHVVLGRPVHFIDNNEDANLQAQKELGQIAKNIGFKHIEFQFEPIAAAYAHEVRLNSEKLALIIDIGGGTSDFTVIRLSSDYIKKTDRKDDILANTGIRIGGNDLDKKLSLSAFMPSLGYKSTYGDKQLTAPIKPFHELSEWSKVNFQYTQKIKNQMNQILRVSHDQQRFKRLVNILENETGHALLQAVENSKIMLTDQQLDEANLDFVESDLSISVPRMNFEKAIDDDISSILNTANSCVQSAGIQANDINLIVLTGGSTEIPLVLDVFKNQFKNAQISDENKLSSVATGLAYDSLRKFN